MVGTQRHSHATAATATWVAAEGHLGSEVDVDPTSAHYGRHWLGPMSEVCEACGASHWPQERLTSSSASAPKFGAAAAAGRWICRLLSRHQSRCGGGSKSKINPADGFGLICGSSIVSCSWLPAAFRWMIGWQEPEALAASASMAHATTNLGPCALSNHDHCLINPSATRVIRYQGRRACVSNMRPFTSQQRKVESPGCILDTNNAWKRYVGETSGST